MALPHANPILGQMEDTSVQVSYDQADFRLWLKSPISSQRILADNFCITTVDIVQLSNKLTASTEYKDYVKVLNKRSIIPKVKVCFN